MVDDLTPEMQSRAVQHTDTCMSPKLAESFFKKGFVGSRFCRQVGVFYPTRRRHNKWTSFTDTARKAVNYSGCLPCGKWTERLGCSICIMLGRTEATSCSLLNAPFKRRVLAPSHIDFYPNTNCRGYQTSKLNRFVLPTDIRMSGQMPRRSNIPELKTDRFCIWNSSIYWTYGWRSENMCRRQLKCDGTRWRTGKLSNGVGSQYPSHYLGTWRIQHYYSWCAHLGCQ